MAALEVFYNATADGVGMEGFINWSNMLVGGMLVTLFMIAMFIVGFGILYRSNIKVGVSIMYVSFACLLMSMVLTLFTVVNELLLIGFALGIGIGVVVSYLEK